MHILTSSMEGDYRPPLDTAEKTPPVNSLQALVERKHLKFKTPEKAYDMLLDLTFEAHHEIAIPEQIEEEIRTLSLAFGFLAYDELTPTKQAIFLARLDATREHFQTDQLELTQDEATLLQRVANGVNIDYDPGTETTPEQRIFPFSSVESRPPKDLSLYTMMTGREKPPEHDPLIVDSEPPVVSVETTT